MAQSPVLSMVDSVALNLIDRWLMGYQPALGAGTVEQGEGAFMAGLATEARSLLENRRPLGGDGVGKMSPRASALLSVIAGR